jgi:hypothetical protein
MLRCMSPLMTHSVTLPSSIDALQKDHSIASLGATWRVAMMRANVASLNHNRVTRRSLTRLCAPFVAVLLKR